MWSLPKARKIPSGAQELATDIRMGKDPSRSQGKTMKSLGPRVAWPPDRAADRSPRSLRNSLLAAEQEPRHRPQMCRLGTEQETAAVTPSEARAKASPDRDCAQHRAWGTDTPIRGTGSSPGPQDTRPQRGSRRAGGSYSPKR